MRKFQKRFFANNFRQNNQTETLNKLFVKRINILFLQKDLFFSIKPKNTHFQKHKSSFWPTIEHLANI